MKRINTKNIKDLENLKNKLNETIDNRIESLKLSENIKSIDNMTFSDLKCLFEGITESLYETNKGKNIIKKYITTIKESKDLSTMYSLYETVKTPKNISNSTVFINQVTNICKGINENKLNKSLKKLSSIVKEGVNVTISNTGDFDKLFNASKKQINESFDYITTNSFNTKNIVEFSNSLEALSNYVKENNEESETIVEGKTATDLNLFLSENLGSLNEWEQKVIIDLTEAELSSEGRKSVFENYKSECISKINEKTEDTDVETRSRLINMKEKLMEKKYNEETIIDDLFKLSELKETLN